MEATRVTNSRSNDRLLYFASSSSLTADNRNLVFISDRTGHPNIFVLDLLSGEVRQLTHNEEGYLKSYQYFLGQEGKGIGKASITLHPESGTIYFLQGRRICCVDLEGNHRVLAEYPDDQVTAYMSISHDGTRLCIPTTDARALEADNFVGGKPDYNIDQRIQDENLNSYLRLYDTNSGKEIITETVPRAFITHVQFCPANKDLILYNHEWSCYDCGIRRMWLWNGAQHKRLRQEGTGRSREDWVVHEIWARGGKSIIYHGKYRNGLMFIGRVNADGTDLVEITIPKDYRGYGHFNTGPCGLLVSDGYYQQRSNMRAMGKPIRLKAGRYIERIIPKAGYIKRILPPRCKRVIRRALRIWSGYYGRWISIQKVDWEKQQIAWIPLCEHASTMTDQDSHPHPIFNHGGSAVFFTSNRGGVRSIYRVSIPKGLRCSTSVDHNRITSIRS